MNSFGGAAGSVETMNAACRRGNQLRDTGRWNEALAVFDDALATDPNEQAALLGRSQTLFRMGRFEEALAGVWKIMGLGGHSLAVWLEAAAALVVLNRLHEAKAALNNALRLAPGAGRVWGLLGDALAREGREAAAEACFRRSARLEPSDPIVRLKLGQWMVQTGRLEEAIGFFNDVRDLTPWLPDAVSGLGQAFISQGRLDEAEPLLQGVLASCGTHLDSRLALARLYLLRGDYVNGWPAYEWRRRRLGAVRPALTGREWLGEPLAGKTLLVYGEQGLGDAIQFLRFVPRLAKLGARVVLLIRKDLRRLARCLAPYARICVEGQALPACDFHISLLSVPFRLRIDMDETVAAIPYLSVEHLAKNALPGLPGGGFKVGLVWAGNATQGNDRLRSASLEAMLCLAAVPGVTLYSLQVGPRAADVAEIAHPALIEDLSPRLSDLADTGDVLGQLDLVITVDTVVAHLAGAMGLPVWVLLSFAPDWRWMLGRDDMPWYPTMRLFRQTEPRRWDDVVDAVRLALLRRVRSHEAFDAPPAAARRAARLVGQGAALQAAGKTAEALAIFARAGRADRRAADLYVELGASLLQGERLAAAEAALRRALALGRRDAVCLTHLGKVLRALGKLDEARRMLAGAWVLAPDDAAVLAALGHLAQDGGRLKEAARYYAWALRLWPQDRDANDGRHALLRRQGLFPAVARPAVDDRLAVWDGTRLDGRTILLEDDASLEEALLFARFIPRLAAGGASGVAIRCRPELARLFAALEGIAEVVSGDGEPPPCDCRAALSALPSLFEPGGAGIPRATAYLKAGGLGAPLFSDGRRKVGLVWAAPPEAASACCPLPVMLRLLALPDIALFALQTGPARADLAATGADALMTDLAPRVHDLADAAAILQRLDLLITVDGPLAHLAGALGRPAFVMLPYAARWHWGEGGENAHWYPSLHLFRQPKPGDWESVLTAVAKALR